MARVEFIRSMMSRTQHSCSLYLVRLKSRRMHSLRVFLFLQRICLMSYRIEVAPEFARRLKNLSKRSLH